MTQTQIPKLPNTYSVRPAPHALLNGEQRGMLDRLDSYKAPFLEERLIGNGTFKDRDSFLESFTEFKKYASLSFLSDGGPSGMMSKDIDEVWHQFILFTREYGNFCQESFGRFLHHSPNTTQTTNARKRETTMNFVRSYNQVFGDVPEIWGLRGDEGLSPYLVQGSAEGCDPNGCNVNSCNTTMCNSITPL
jgi:hypothetical protein